jgi:hypothetical protein
LLDNIAEMGNLGFPISLDGYGRVKSLPKPLKRLLDNPRLARHFTFSSRGISCRYYDAPDLEIGTKKYAFFGQRISPIVLGSLRDLSFYAVRGIPEEFQRDPEAKAIDMYYLEKYLWVPTRSGKTVFVCDDHTHAAFGMALAHKAGILKDKSILMHIDEHEDNCSFPFRSVSNPWRSLGAMALFCWKDLEVSEFISLVAEYKSPIIDHNGVYFVLPFYNGRAINRYTNYFNSGNPIIARQFDGYSLSLERVAEIIDLKKGEGKTVVCDIDLDFFWRYYSADGKIVEVSGFSLEDSIVKMIEAAKKSDFITVATSPNYLLVPNQIEVTRYLLNRIVQALDR